MKDIATQISKSLTGDFEKNISSLQKEMLKHEQVDCPVIHRFSPGLYIREVFLPTGAFAIGHFQKTEHLNVFLKGKVRMLNNDGSVSELSAPMIFTGKPGRKCGYIVEDVVWMNVYPTDETDVEKLEEMFLDKELHFEELQSIKTKQLLAANNSEDYINVLREYGFTEKQAREQSENEEDQIPFPPGDYKVMVGNSAIEGKGLLATANIEKDEFIAPARINGKRTPAGRYTNHSPTPNAEMRKMQDDIYLVALSEIHGCRGGFSGEEITVDYRKCLQINGVSPCQA